MFRVFLSFALCCSLSFAYFVVEDNYTRQVEVLKNLDIDAAFLQDSMFASIKEDISLYKQKQFLKTLENGARFIPILRDMIEEAGIPSAFLYMAMVESGFSTKAYSKAKASGIWQFIQDTARKYDLTIDDYVDERRDPIKSTEAAIKYLKTLHSRFGKWYLAAMAYNCGEGRVNSAIKKAGTDDLYVLLDDNAKYLPAETRKYIRKIITMAYLAEDANFLVENGAGHFLNDGGARSDFIKKEISGGSPLSEVAKSIGMSLDELWSYNPHLNYFFTPPNKKTYHIYIPNDKEQRYANDFDPLNISSTFDVHVVGKGDTFNKIAKKYKVSYKVIQDFNKMNSDVIKPGQKLIIPILRTARDTKQDARYHIIESGDTLYSISVKYKLSVAQLKQANNLESEIIYPGLKLEIPKAR